MGKTTTKTIVVLAAVFVLIAVFQAHRTSGPSPEEFRAQALFPELDLAAVAAVQIESAGASVTLRRAEGGLWGVEERGGYAVDGEKLRRLVLGIAQLQARDRLTDNPEKYAAVGLADPSENGTVSLLDGDGKTLGVLRLGQQKPSKGAGGSSAQFVRAGDDPAVYLVVGAPTVDAGATGWLDRKLLDLAADKVMAVAVTRPQGSFAASRKQPADPLTLETPLPPGRSADSGALGDLGRALVNLTCDDVLGAGDEAAEGAAFDVAFVAEGADRVRYTVSLAQEDGQNFARLAAEALPTPEEETPPGEEAGEEPPAKAEPDPDTAASALNGRHGGWTYTIPTYVFDRLNKSLDDLLVNESPE